MIDHDYLTQWVNHHFNGHFWNKCFEMRLCNFVNTKGENGSHNNTVFLQQFRTPKRSIINNIRPNESKLSVTGSKGVEPWTPIIAHQTKTTATVVPTWYWGMTLRVQNQWNSQKRFISKNGETLWPSIQFLHKISWVFPCAWESPLINIVETPLDITILVTWAKRGQTIGQF